MGTEEKKKNKRQEFESLVIQTRAWRPYCEHMSTEKSNKQQPVSAGEHFLSFIIASRGE